MSKPDLTQRFEHTKLVQEFFKHLTTLSAGSIVIIATLLDKAIQTPQAKWLIVGSIVSFLISVLSGMTVYFFLIILSPIHSDADAPSPSERVIAVSLIGGLGGFFVGIVCLGIFAAINLT